MIRLSLRQEMILWALMALLILFCLVFAGLFPSSRKLLLAASDGVYIQSGDVTSYFLDETAIPQWSPDGRWISFQSANRLLISNSLSQIEAQYHLEYNSRFLYHPVWAEDNQRLVFFTEDASLGNYHLNLFYREDSLNIAYLIPHEEILLAWWETAEEIHFLSANNNQVELQVLNLANTSLGTIQSWQFESLMRREAIRHPDGESFILPAISPNISNFDLYEFHLNGESQNISNRRSHNDTNPLWSPDGEHFVYRAFGAGSHFIFLRDFQTREEQVLARFDGVQVRDIRWRDNENLALITAYSGETKLCIINIFSEFTNCEEVAANFSLLNFWQNS